MHAMSVFSILQQPSQAARLAALAVAVLSCASLVACGSFNGASNRLATAITPYRAEVVQGNFVSKEQVEALRPGMARAQVRDILGSPLVTSVFHADRWDYVFTIRRQGIEAQSRKLTVFFKGDELEKFEGDTMPSETEFVAKLDSSRTLGKVPNLQASDEELANAQSKTPGNAPTVMALPAPSTPQVYPPLEPVGK
jgi:outer membrane protein assembly factor BamE